MANDLFRRFIGGLQDCNLLPFQKPVLVAVSGGGDSVALLDLMCRLADESHLQLIVAHLDHALRPDSSADADFVVGLAKQRGLPVVSERRDVSAILSKGKGGPEAIARQVRRSFLEKTLLEHGCRWIALGHHKDDQAETFLIRLLRGSGMRGLSGMHLKSPPYVRPLLGFRRSELREYLVERQLTWIEDDTNMDLHFMRNRVRHELLPLLQSFNPNIVDALATLCEQFADDERCWRQLIDCELAEAGMLMTADDGLVLPCDLLRWLPAAFATRLIRAALEKVRGNLRGISHLHVTMVQSLIESDQPQAEVHLPGSWIGRRYEKLWFRIGPPAFEEQAPLLIEGPGCYPLPDGRLLQVEWSDRQQGEDANSVEFCAAKVPFPLRIHTWQPGDRLQPKGMSGTRKLQDLFVDFKLTKEQRTVQPLISQGERILWVVGLRRCEGAQPVDGQGTGKVLRMQVLPS